MTRYEGEADDGAEVQQTFAKFAENQVKDYSVRFHDFPDLHYVEERILGFVARLFPDAFHALDAFRARHARYLDKTIWAFDREVQFYVAYMNFIAPMKAAGLEFCYPVVSAGSKQIKVIGSFDLALAAKLVPRANMVVRNDFYLEDPERIFVVSGPNHGGKTTFARMFGQLHYLASLGYPVPGREASLFLPDRIFTHFEREEDLTTLRGKFEDELIRIRDVLDQATGHSVLVMNESFASTTLRDALFVGRRIHGSRGLRRESSRPHSRAAGARGSVPARFGCFGISPQARRSAMRTADNLRATDIAAAALFKPSMGGWIVQVFPGGVGKREQ